MPSEPTFSTCRGPSRRARSITIVALAVATLAAACGSEGDGADSIRLSQDSPDLTPTATGSTADPTRTDHIRFVTLDGTTRGFADYSGQPLVVNFFAAWCPSCVAEMPHFERVFSDLEGEVAFLGLSQDASRSDAEGLVAQTGVTYDIGWDPDLEVFGEFGGYAMPTTVFIDADGRVVDVFAGALNEDALRERVEAIRA